MLTLRRRAKVAPTVTADRPTYRVQQAPGGYRIVGPSGTVDVHFFQSSADYFARLLNAGLATLNMHACVGSRVVESGNAR